MKNKQTNKNRLRLRDDEVKIIEEYRGLKKAAHINGVNVDDVKHAWLKSDKASLFVKNPNFQLAKQNVFVERLIKELDNHSPIYKKIKNIEKK